MKDITIDKRKLLFRCLLFTIIFVLIFLLVQEILSPQWRYPEFNDNTDDVIHEYFDLQKDTVQALFFGTSHVVYSIDPMRIYEQSNIVSYNLGTCGQPIAVSINLLKEALKTQKPKVVFYDVGNLFSEEFINSNYRYVIDNLPFGRNKIELARDYSDHFGGNNRFSYFLSAFFPIYSYHDRWSELKPLDFEIVQSRSLYRKGYFLYTPSFDGNISISTMNSIHDFLEDEPGRIERIINGTASYEELADPIYDEPKISDVNMNSFLQFKEICDENGIDLILFKVPTVCFPQNAESGWTPKRSGMVKELAEEYGLSFLDLLYDYNIGIDWAYDTPDGGIHLNYSGAKKISDFFAGYLKEQLQLPNAVSEDYELDIALYDAMCQVSELQSARNIRSFLEEASRRKNTTVFFSACDDMKKSLSDETVAVLHNAGILTDFDMLGYRDSFLGVIEDGVSVYESFSDRVISYSGQSRTNCSYTMTSAGWLVGANSSIYINGVDYSMHGRGINVVVYDNEYGLVLDSACFDTCAFEDPVAVRNNHQTGVYLREYEERLMVADADGEFSAEA